MASSAFVVKSRSNQNLSSATPLKPSAAYQNPPQEKPSPRETRTIHCLTGPDARGPSSAGRRPLVACRPSITVRLFFPMLDTYALLADVSTAIAYGPFPVATVASTALFVPSIIVTLLLCVFTTQIAFVTELVPIPWGGVPSLIFCIN